jgi:hypothetical protein
MCEVLVTPDRKILEALRDHEVPFIAIGGHAVNFHGYGRATEDTDVVWFRSPESEQSLLRALTELEAQYIGKEIDPKTGIERTYPVTESFVRLTHLMMLWTKYGFVDIFDYIPGEPAEDVQQLAASSEEEHGIRYVSLAWLRRMKKTAGRGKDVVDLENLPE